MRLDLFLEDLWRQWTRSRVNSLWKAFRKLLEALVTKLDFRPQLFVCQKEWMGMPFEIVCLIWHASRSNHSMNWLRTGREHQLFQILSNFLSFLNSSEFFKCFLQIPSLIFQILSRFEILSYFNVLF